MTLATFFVLGATDALNYLVYAILIMAIAFPLYRMEYILGFVTAMTFTFGAVLPLAFSLESNNNTVRTGTCIEEGRNKTLTSYFRNWNQRHFGW